MIEVKRLTKRFGALTAVDDLSFVVQPGRVTGFLGPNGAGKTTTLRCGLALIRPTVGEVTFSGRLYRELKRPQRRVGAALEASSFHPGRTALNHLRMLAPSVGVQKARCEETLDLVGLTPAADKRVGQFSLGMRGRLALAVALLGDPEFLLLDEPTNGLDPEGIAWVRNLLRALAAQGRVVLMSSHLLSEVQQCVDDIVIIGQGKLVHTSPLAALSDLSQSRTLVVPGDLPRFIRLAIQLGWRLEESPTGPIVVGTPPAEIGRACLWGQIEVHQLTPQDQGLEAAFFNLTEGKEQVR